MWQASILVRALVHGWRHRGGAHMCVEGVGAAVVIGLDSCDSPSALSVPRAHSSDQSALGGPLRCSALLRVYNLAVLVGRPQLRVLHSEEVVLAVQNSCPVAGGHHSRIV